MDEDFMTFIGEICFCGHEAHGDGKCYDMNFNGAVWSNCRCERTSLDFCLILTPKEFENVSRIHDNRKFARAA